MIIQDIDWDLIDGRLKELDRETVSSKASKRKNSLYDVFVQFVQQSGQSSLLNCTPNDVRRFLVWKDKFGKTTVHSIKCEFLGQRENLTCGCPMRLASATVEHIILQLVTIFEEHGLGRTWDIFSKSGNPATAPLVKEYLKLIQEEQAKAHILPKQAKPIFLNKVKAISAFIQRELLFKGLPIKQQYVLMRDQAWFKLQFFAGDRASDLSHVVSQEVKVLNDSSGLVFQHTFGKTLRGDKAKHNTFVVKKCDDLEVCPVRALHNYVEFCRSHGVNLSTGYLFRIVNESGKVLDQAVNYSVMYERLQYYLATLGLYEGETPHSFRSGCAVTIALSDAASNVDQAMEHVGWFGKSSAEYYSRMHSLVDAGVVAEKLAKSVGEAESYEKEFKDKADYCDLRNFLKK